MNCWWCCHPPAELHMPLSYKNEKFKTTGQFCSWECMKSYAMKNTNQNKMGNICMLINLMRVKHYGGDSRQVIMRAPSPYCLKMFGGTIDIEDFRKSNHKTLVVTMPNEEHKLQTIHIKAAEENKTVSDTDLKDRLKRIHSSSGENEPLKLKRTKPLKNQTQNNLENTLGLKKKKSSLLIGGS